MKLRKDDIERILDVSAVQSPDGEKEVKKLINAAQRYNFACLYVLPCWVFYLRKNMVKNSSVHIASTVGFPSGAHTKEVKVFEAKELIKQGVQELDLSLNVGMLRSGRYDYVKDEIKMIVEKTENITVKVILEIDYLANDNIKKACELSIDAGADFIKTSSGWTKGGATFEIVSMINSFVGNAIKVKASGGIRDLNTIIQMYKLGVSRFGINLNSAINILHECEGIPSEIISF